MLTLFNINATLGLDSSGFNSGIKDAEGSAKGLSASTVAVGNIMADAFEAVIAKVGEFASAVVDAGAKQETALAKVNTIMDTSIMNTEDMSSAIRTLSSDMGISVEELSDTVYNAISATGDTANAVSLAEQASKLATAGFTDTGSALSVLTTAMNAYGLSAEEASAISDSLIQVQNLGVTTVSELSSSMGKAIASASAYGVDLSNLESAYVSITKAGINTAEGTTYISSMLKELGSDSSSVSKIIKEQTGKSFNELMSEGYSLGDTLGILNESVNGDSTALMNLWSSAEAGKASSAIVGQGLTEFNANLEQISGTAGATEEAYATMADTFEHKQEVMQTKMDNMKASLFEELEPMLMNLIGWLEESVFPILDWIIENIDTIAPIVLGIVTALGGLAIVLNITKWLGLMKNAVIALNIAMSANPIGIVIALIAGLIAAIAALWVSNEDFRNGVIAIWNGLKEAVGKVITWVKDKINTAKTWGRDLIDNFVQGIKDKIQKVKDTVSSVANTVKSFLGFSEPEEGPLSNFHTYAPDMMELFAQGIKDNEDIVADQIAESFNFGRIGTIGADYSSSYSTNSLLRQIAEFLPSLGNQNIILDTGALVGQTASQYDKALGKLYTQQMRYV